MKQFSEVSSLINKFGYRYSKGNFTFQIERNYIIFFTIFKVGSYGYKDELKEVANTIRSCLQEYYNDWKCEYEKTRSYGNYNGLVISNWDKRMFLAI